MVSESELLYYIGGSVLIVGGTILFFEIALRVVSAVALRSGVRRRTVTSVAEAVRIVYIVLAALGLIAFFGFASTLAVLTVTGVAGVVVSFALQPTLSNMISGFYLVREEILRVGDEITFGSIHGRVVRIRLRNCWIRTASGEIAFVTNTTLYNGPTINHTRSGRIASEYLE